MPLITYNFINVNLQNAWSNITHKVTIPVAGTYFIDVSAYLCGSNSGGFNVLNPGKRTVMVVIIVIIVGV